MPGIEQLNVVNRHKQVARFRLIVVQQSGPIIFDDLRMRRHPRGMPATGAEPLFARHPVPPWDDNRFGSWSRGVGDHAAWGIDPDRARDIRWHARRVGGKNTALVDGPGGARIRFAERLDHLDIGWQIDLRATQGTR